MYLDVYHLLSHLTVKLTFIRQLRVGEDETVYDTTAKFEVIMLRMGVLG